MATESAKIKNKISQYLVGSVMDIGCGDELIIDEAFGIDGRDFPCVKHKTHSLYSLQNQMPDMLEKFDCVFSSHVLEHLPDAYKAIDEWTMFLKQNGYFILYLPDGEHYDNYENKEHFQDTTYKQFVFWFKRAFCGEALNYKGEQYAEPKFNLIESGLDVGDNRYSFYLVAQKTS